MTQVVRILFLPGDGIGPAVMEQARRVIGWFGARGLGLAVEEDLVGGAAYDALERVRQLYFGACLD